MRKFIIILIIVLSVLGIAFGLVWFTLRSGQLQRAMFTVVQEKIGGAESDNVLGRMIGLEQPRTYLVLFLNNTELRPAGGFIGAYAVVNMDQGIPTILKVEGTEILDNLAPQNFETIPPAPIAKYLKVKRWNFRDSNWSPDFSISAQKALELYKAEKGLEAENISGVVGFTPTILEEILKIMGPIEVGGEKFSADNVTEKLEYEVEYNYAEKGLDFSDRKHMLSDLVHAVFAELRKDALLNWAKYFSLAREMLLQKQIAFYSPDATEQKFIRENHWSGEMNDAEGDYVLWVDANLGALKTDASINRELVYRIFEDKKGQMLGEVKMIFNHQGVYDWRTSQYLDYARLYVPIGSELVAVTGAGSTDYLKNGTTDVGEENGRKWFGFFIRVAPGESGELTFTFKLDPTVVAQITAGEYNLTVQKQMGTIAPKLTLDLDFGKKLVFGSPGENKENHGDSKYSFITELRTDRKFVIKF